MFTQKASGEIETRLVTLQKLDELTSALNTDEAEIVRTDRWWHTNETRSVLSIDDRDYVFKCLAGGLPAGPPIITYRLEIQWKNEDRLETYSIPKHVGTVPKCLVEAKSLVEEWRKLVVGEKGEFERRIRTIRTKAPEVWGFFDFLYFSLITQTTVGYGDMLPNATKIRLIVSVQVVFAYVMLVVVLNVVLSSTGGPA